MKHFPGFKIARMLCSNWLLLSYPFHEDHLSDFSSFRVWTDIEVTGNHNSWIVMWPWYVSFSLSIVQCITIWNSPYLLQFLKILLFNLCYFSSLPSTINSNSSIVFSPEKDRISNASYVYDTLNPHLERLWISLYKLKVLLDIWFSRK